MRGSPWEPANSALMTQSPPLLAIVVPVYNEAASIEGVLREWHAALSGLVEDFCFVAIDDGSRDASLAEMERLKADGLPLEIVSRENRGHGQTCLQGYGIAVEMGAEWVFQIDSDGQCDPRYFDKVWALRESADVVYGCRRQRDDGLKRYLVTQVLKGYLLLFQGTFCRDPNVPYRLMRTRVLPPILAAIPPSFHLANIAVSYHLKRAKVRHAHTAIGFRERTGGEPAVPWYKFLDKAKELHRNFGEMHAALKG